MSDNRTPTKTRYTYEFGEPDIAGNSRVTAKLDDRIVLYGIYTPGYTAQHPPRISMYKICGPDEKVSFYSEYGRRRRLDTDATIAELEGIPGQLDRMKARIEELERTNRQLDESVSHIVRDITLSTIDEDDDVISRITNLCELLPCSLSGEILSTIAEFDADAPSMCAAIGELLAPAAQLQRMEPR